jgi:hypothetical protein
MLLSPLPAASLRPGANRSILRKLSPNGESREAPQTLGRAMSHSVKLAKPGSPDAALLWAVAAGDLDAARQAVADGADGRCVNDEGKTALMAAASAEPGLSHFIPLLLPISDPFQTRQPGGDSALAMAAAGGDASCVRLLIPVSDARALNERTHTALMLAAQSGHADCVRLLLPVSDPAAKDKRQGWAAIHMAARSRSEGAPECCEMLAAAAGVDLRAGLLSNSWRGRTALLFALDTAFDGLGLPNGHGLDVALRSIRALILAGADVSIATESHFFEGTLEQFARSLGPNSISATFSEAFAERERREILAAAKAPGLPAAGAGAIDAGDALGAPASAHRTSPRI